MKKTLIIGNSKVVFTRELQGELIEKNGSVLFLVYNIDWMINSFKDNFIKIISSGLK